MPTDLWFGAFVWPEGTTFDELKRLCQKAEALKYDLFMITDHFMNMREPNRPDRHPLEAWTTLAGLAAVTSQIKLGPLVTCYAYRAPPVLAKMATTVDIISNGRLVFGIGAGWHKQEFEDYFGRFPPVKERLTGLEETVAICKAMFSNERTTYNGTIFKVENALNSPLPVQRPIPVLIGGGGEKRTLKIAARHANINHIFANDLKTLDSKLEALKRHCTAIGRDYDEIRKGVGVAVVLGSDEKQAEARLTRLARTLGTSEDSIRSELGDIYGTPEKVAGILRQFVSRGIGLITPRFFYQDEMELFANEVIPRIVQ
jgi:F420-dependent oxidoreductase-like protein